MNRILCSIFFLCVFCSLNANVVLPAIFSDHMVLQQNTKIEIWGWAKPLEKVELVFSWQKDTLRTVGDPNGNWSVTVLTPKAGGPHTIYVKGYNHFEITDILIGETWLCSGQSNMEWKVRDGIENLEATLEGGNQPEIRFFVVNYHTAIYPQIDFEGRWVVCTPSTLKDLSAVGYFFARKIREYVNTPIGLIVSVWGGTPAEAWISKEKLDSEPKLTEAAKKLVQGPWGPIGTGLIYNAMISPLTHYKIAGVLWYQGEDNTRNPLTYNLLLTTLIEDWRARWGYTFPFYFVQITPWMYGREYEGVLIQDAQRKVMNVPFSGMVVTNDIGDPHNQHPHKKKEVGDRLALWALNHTYLQQQLEFSGPIYQTYHREGHSIRIYFEFTGDGLISKKNPISDFMIAGANKKFVHADASIDGHTIVVSSPAVKKPVAVRFAWSNGCEPGLFNSSGLPASCFRTDEWKIKGY